MKINQFAIYRIDKNTKGKDLWHLPFYEVRAKKLHIRIEYYKMLHIDEMEKNEKANDIWKRVQKIVEVSDVLVMNNGGEISCYYINED